jgi:hypothetical protein
MAGCEKWTLVMTARRTATPEADTAAQTDKPPAGVFVALAIDQHHDPIARRRAERDNITNGCPLL